MIECIECEASIKTYPGLEKGEVLTCQDCGIELEVKSVNPIKVALAPEEEEDWGQ